MNRLTPWLLLAAITLPCAARAQSPTLVTEDLVSAPVAQVWSAFTTREGIESWMVARTDIDLRIGALWRTSYRRDSTLDDGTAIHQAILAFDPERMLAFRTVKVPAGFPFASAISRSWTVVYFEPMGPTSTRVTIRMLGYDDTAESAQMRAFFETGNRATLDALVKTFAAP